MHIVPFCPDSPDTFHLNQNLFWMHKEGDVILSISDQGTLSFAFLLVLLLRISQPLTLKMMTCMEKETNTAHSAFPPSPLLPVSGR